LEKWNEDTIKEHQEKMINYFLETFYLSEPYKSKSNWNTTVTESTAFSPLDSDATDLAEGNKPVELRVFDYVIKVKTWQDVFIKFIEQTKHNAKFDFEYILRNQGELFNRNETILKWIKLKNIIDDKIELSDRYKTLNGKTWANTTNLTEDELFLHVNISASTCMARITNIMNKFNISDKDVEINLK
jgi:hypothetical protein